MVIRSRFGISRTKRAELREKRRDLHTSNRKAKAEARAFNHNVRLQLAEQRRISKLRPLNFKLPHSATATRSVYPSGAYPVTLDMSGFRWIKTHSETFRRKRPLQMEAGYYTKIAAARSWSYPIKGVYINSTDKVQVIGTLEPVNMVNPLVQVGLLQKFATFGDGFYPVTNVEAASIAGNNVLKQVQERKLNLAVSLGEGAETFKFLRQSVKDVNGLLKAIDSKSRNPGRTFEQIARGHPKNAAQMASFSRKAFNAAEPDRRWLEYNFALLPLADDAQGAAEALAAMAPDLRSLYAASSVRVSDSLDLATTAGAIQDGYVIQYSGTVLSRFVNRVDYVVDEGTLKKLGELGFSNPASYLYQTTSLSFVLDWALPVGEFLDLWTAPLGCNLVAAYQATYMTAELDKQFKKTPTWKKVSLVANSEMWYYRGYIRRNTYVFPYPSLYVKNPLSSWTAITSSALLKQRLK